MYATIAYMNTHLVPALREIETLFRPFTHRKLQLHGRIIMAPAAQHSVANGIPTPQMEQYYRVRAENEPALILTEGLAIDTPTAALTPSSPVFYGGRSLRAWKNICRAVHSCGCKIAPQLYHAGMARQADDAAPAIGPSGISPTTLQQITTPMSRQQMEEVKVAFARTAGYARILGFDAVEIDGAHGYLIDQFLWKETNHRTDEYGGSIAARTRFACEVIHSVRKAVGRSFPIIFRLAQWKPGHDNARLANTAHELEQLLHPLCDAGVDIFHCSAIHYARPALEGNPLTLAAWVRMLTGKPTISAGGIGKEHNYAMAHATPAYRAMESILRMLRAQAFDLIAIEHALHQDPAWLSKLRSGD